MDSKSKFVKFMGYMWITLGIVGILMMIFGAIAAFFLPADVKGRQANYLFGGISSIAGLIFSLVMFPLGINTIKFKTSARTLNLILGPFLLIIFGIVITLLYVPYLLNFGPNLDLLVVFLELAIIISIIIALICIFTRKNIKEQFK